MNMIEEYESYLESSNEKEKKRFNKILEDIINVSGDNEESRFKALVTWEKDRLIDTRIRGIRAKDWDLFKLYCLEESVKRRKNISANSMLKELISVAVASMPIK